MTGKEKIQFTKLLGTMVVSVLVLGFGAWILSSAEPENEGLQKMVVGFMGMVVGFWCK